MNRASQPMELAWQGEKLAYLSRFLTLAFSVSDKVILHSAAGEWDYPPPDGFIDLAAALHEQFPNLRFLPFDRSWFTTADFHGNHLNLQGSRKNSLRILEYLKAENLLPSEGEGSLGFQHLFAERELPPLETWHTIISEGASLPRIVDGRRIEASIQTDHPADVQFISPPLIVVPGQPAYFVFTVAEDQGAIVTASLLELGWDGEDGQRMVQRNTYGLLGTPVMALTPRTDRVQIGLGIHLEGTCRYTLQVERLVQPNVDIGLYQAQ